MSEGGMMSMGAHTQDRAIRVISVFTAVLTALVLVIAVASLPVILDTNDVSTSLAIESKVSACRAELRSRFDEAVADVTIAKSRLALVQNLELEAHQKNEPTDALLEQSRAARESLQSALLRLEESVARLDPLQAVEDETAYLDRCGIK